MWRPTSFLLTPPLPVRLIRFLIFCQILHLCCGFPRKFFPFLLHVSTLSSVELSNHSDTLDNIYIMCIFALQIQILFKNLHSLLGTIAKPIPVGVFKKTFRNFLKRTEIIRRSPILFSPPPHTHAPPQDGSKFVFYCWILSVS